MLSFSLLLVGLVGPSSRIRVSPQASASSALPPELAEGAWLEAAVPAEPKELASQSGEEMMNTVLTWLPEMLMALELGDENEEEDSDFVQVARPYLHTKEYHVVRGGSMLAVAQELWSHVEAAKFLEGEGGTMLLLLPALSDERAFDGLAEATRAALSREMPKASLQACHPSRPGAVERTPLPLFQLFCDNPELLVQGGSLGDAAAFLG